MTESKPVLYGYCRSSATWRVRIALEHKGIGYDHKFINLLKKEQFTEEYKKIVPTQKVPAFVDGTSGVITQSQSIIEYLEETYPQKPLLPKDVLTRAHVREICQIIACDIHPLQNLGVLARVAGDDLEKQTEFAKEMITKGFRGLEVRLQAVSGTFTVGDNLTMADVFLVPMVGNAERRGVDMNEFPRLAQLNQSLSALPEFQKAHPSAQPDFPKN
ncbi:maleylacetoacetate isomerase [Sporodiniella umbellata]|nr:maleylacetoacetate isomerase [Sporodiniella umbellata]